MGPPEALDTETVDAAIDAIDAIGRDELSVVKAVSPLLAKIPGWTAEELVRNNTLFLVHPDDRGLGIANWMEMLARPGFSQRAVMRYRYRDGAGEVGLVSSVTAPFCKDCHRARLSAAGRLFT